ncbi:DNA mismatch repair protein MutL [Secundilactobacillus oryzae JCM 18671]|uniref:DNA mismatch repair protein MutL n=1 Tax=Secundilactobacillus oryzae JCM 18671 TaxID=1291743 RepID=A0A081BJ26_9LACO|nr:DNA mismatch repair endonuclease MutL [Secundilactobacillus oryzae]GAK48044.1 DNA mismatch repair protein MutL [Secundilactobacillus oryzae JCM 18671]
MAKIHELSAVLADQIAAGEVIERPASVVKELVENAIDANSSEIDIKIEEAGLKLISVIDDGDGIASDDVAMAFKRHATSKIIDRQDLFKVHSLGFRGEALPSIASVADVTLSTSTGGEGTEIHISGGQVIEEKPAVARKGTTITVKDLFYNVPARLKYVKSVNTELSKITDIVNRLALSYPAISFSLTHNGRELMRSAGRGDQLQVISGIYGISNAREMVKIENHTDDFTVSGYVSLPKLTRSSRSYITLLLNGRYIHNFQLTKAIVSGYGSKLMVGRFPLAVINIQMDALLVDVNVHPTKQEVRITKEDELTELISQTIFNRLASENLIPDAAENLNKRVNEKVNTDQLSINLNEVSEKYDFQADVPTPEVTKETSEPQTKGALFDAITSDAPYEPLVIKTKADLNSDRMKQFEAKYAETTSEPTVQTAESEATLSDDMLRQPVSKEERFPDLRYIGQMHGTYLLAEDESGLYILDQHAAQERVNYEYYRKAIGEVSDDQQNLLVPIMLDYPTADVLRIQSNLEKLASAGIELEAFGQNSFIVRHHPTWFKAGQEEDTIKEMIDWVIADGRISVADFREKTAIMMSCKRAIKANHHLDDQQAKALIEKLKTAENPFNCPHGRPVLVHFDNQDMEKMFKRIQDAHQTGLTDFA